MGETIRLQFNLHHHCSQHQPHRNINKLLIVLTIHISYLNLCQVFWWESVHLGYRRPNILNSILPGGLCWLLGLLVRMFMGTIMRSNYLTTFLKSMCKEEIKPNDAFFPNQSSQQDELSGAGLKLHEVRNERAHRSALHCSKLSKFQKFQFSLFKF